MYPKYYAIFFGDRETNYIISLVKVDSVQEENTLKNIKLGNYTWIEGPHELNSLAEVKKGI